MRASEVSSAGEIIFPVMSERVKKLEGDVLKGLDNRTAGSPLLSKSTTGCTAIPVPSTALIELFSNTVALETVGVSEIRLSFGMVTIVFVKPVAPLPGIGITLAEK